MSEVSLLAALGAGVLALLSPCSALLLPAFFASAFTSRAAMLGRTAVFYLGLLLTLVPLGSGAAWASQLFYGHRGLLVTVSGWTLVALGVFQLLGGGFALPFAARLQGYAARRRVARAAPADATADATAVSRSGLASTLLLGAVYGLAGFCSGPVLGAILTLAMTSGSPVEGGLLLAVYALGMAVPLFALATLWDRFGLARRPWVRGRELVIGPLRVHTTSLVAGLLFITMGALFLRYQGMAGLTGPLGSSDTTDFEVRAQTWLLGLAGTPLWVLPLVVAAVAGVVAWRRLRT